MAHLPALLRDSDSSIAVVGATDDPAKYGYRIYRNLKAKGFKVYPVNPTRDVVDGDRTYAKASDIPDPPTIVDIVVPPRRTLRVLTDCLEAGLMNVWVQPGAENPEVLAFLEENGFNYQAGGPCIMVESRMLA